MTNLLKRKRDELMKPKHALQEAIGFAPEDLAINEGGRLSESQYQKLKQDFSRWLLFNLATIVIGFFAYNGFQSGPKTYNDIGSLFLFYLLLSPFFLFTLNKWIRLMLDILNRKVNKTEGYIELDIRSNKSGNHFRIQNQDVLFEVDKPIFLAFKNHEPYLIYFVPYSKTIVAAEWLRGSDL